MSEWEIDRQTDAQTDTQTNRQSDGQTETGTSLASGQTRIVVVTYLRNNCTHEFLLIGAYASCFALADADS